MPMVKIHALHKSVRKFHTVQKQQASNTRHHKQNESFYGKICHG